MQTHAPARSNETTDSSVCDDGGLEDGSAVVNVGHQASRSASLAADETRQVLIPADDDVTLFFLPGLHDGAGPRYAKGVDE